jgi:hypothetical protein
LAWTLLHTRTMPPRDANWIDASHTRSHHHGRATGLTQHPIGPARNSIVHGRMWPPVYCLRTMATPAGTRSQDPTTPLPTTLLPSRRGWPQRCGPVLPRNGIRQFDWPDWQVARGKPRCSLQRHCTERSGTLGKAPSPHHGGDLCYLVHGKHERIPYDEACRCAVDTAGLAQAGAYVVDGLQVAGSGRNGDMDNWLG